MVGPIPSSSGLYSKQQTGAIVIHAVPSCTLRILLRASAISAVGGVDLPLCFAWVYGKTQQAIKMFLQQGGDSIGITADLWVF